MPELIDGSDLPDEVEDYLDFIAKEILPHGAGIDRDWRWYVATNGKVTFSNSYHGMTEHGMYDGWADFHVRIGRIEKKESGYFFSWEGWLDFKLHFSSFVYAQGIHRRRWFDGLREHLEESIFDCVRDHLLKM